MDDNARRTPAPEPSEEGLSRRQAIGRMMTLLATAASSGSALLSPASPESVHQHARSGVATPLPNAPPAKAFFTPDDKATVRALADLIIPADAVSPGAKAAKVEEHIDFVVANSQSEIQSQWTEGLHALEQFCRERAGGTFLSLSSAQREMVLREIARGESSPGSPAERFFVRLKHATADGFYTSKIGLLDDLKYQGNTYVEGPATCREKLAGSSGFGGLPAQAGEELPAAGTAATNHPTCEPVKCRRRPPTRPAI